MEAVEANIHAGLTSMGTLCNCFAMQRDAYYKHRKRAIRKQSINKQVVKMVENERKEQPRVGVRKLYEALESSLKAQAIKVGRDRLFTILREEGLLVRRKRVTCRTTNSYHRFYKYSNLVKDKEVSAPNQVWVSDITYIRTVKGFCYLALITDMYSRKIVGYDISDTLELSGCLRALQKALRQARPAAGLVHHSDRGIQYCSNQYVAMLQKKGIAISMTEENHCYENAIAERVNGILKDEFYLDQVFYNTDYACKAAESAIQIYNNKRLHLSLNYKTPNMVFYNN